LFKTFKSIKLFKSFMSPTLQRVTDPHNGLNFLNDLNGLNYNVITFL